MDKKYRVKRYYGKGESSYRAKPHPVMIVLSVLVLAGLLYLGTLIYKPAFDFILNIGKTSEETSRYEPEISVPQETSSAPAPEPEPKPPAAPEFDKLRIAYMPRDIAADTARTDEFLAQLSGTPVNAVMVDIKSPDGWVLFKSKNEMAAKWGAIDPKAIDLKALADKLGVNGLSLTVKMSAFRDPKAAGSGRLEYAISYQNSDFLWLDESPEKGGKPWLNPYSVLTRAYLDSLALEAVDIGAKLVALEDVRFPDFSGVYATFGSDALTMSRAEILKSYVTELNIKTEEKGARTAMCFPVTAVTYQEGEDNRYGGSILKIFGKYIMPGVGSAQFDGNYSLNGLEISQPREKPADAVKTAINYIKQAVPPDTSIIPMLDGGVDNALTAAQISAAGELLPDEYVIYSADGAYKLK